MDRRGPENHDLDGIRERLRTYFFASRLTRTSAMAAWLVLLNVAAYVAFRLLAPTTSGQALHPAALLIAGAKITSLVEEGEVWRLVSSTFLHASTSHLLVNCVGTYFLAQVTANVFGSAGTFVLYVTGGIGGSIASTLMSPDASVGASGAIYSLLGAMAAFGALHRKRIPAPLKKVLLAGAVTWVVMSLAYTLGSDRIDSAAHAGGALTGAMLGLLYGRRLPVFSTSPLATPRPVKTAAVLCIAALAGSAFMSAKNLLLGPGPARVELAMMDLGDISIPYPAGWKRGRLSGTCKPDPTASPADHRGPACFKDPYGATFVVGLARDLGAGFMMDPSMTLEFGLNVPLREVRGDVTHRFLMLDRKWAMAFACYTLLEPRYERLVSALVAGVRIHRGRTRDTGEARGQGSSITARFAASR